MNTSDSRAGGGSSIGVGADPAPFGADAPSASAFPVDGHPPLGLGVGPGAAPGPGGGSPFGVDLGGEIARLASQLFSQMPVPVSGHLPAPLGFGIPGPGAAVAVPPPPPPFASAPFPKESDLRGIPTTAMAGSPPLPGGLPLGLVGELPAAAGGPLYFLEIAGHPDARVDGARLPARPGVRGEAPAGIPTQSDAPDATSPPEPVSERVSPDSSAPTLGTDSDGEGSRTGIGWAPEALTLSPAVGLSTRIFDPYTIKRDFPILRQRVNGRPLVWLDNAATTQKPRSVIDRLSYFYANENSNVHRAAHTLAARATDAYEGARDKVRRFLNAPSSKEIVFVRGATEAINLVAKSWGHRNVNPGDEIVISWLEHHANIVPWQQLVSEKGARLRIIPVDDRGQVVLEEYEKLLGPRTRLVSISQVSNALGTIVPVRDMTAMAHRHGARVLIDGAQAVSHMAVDVQALDCDFYCFSGHKVFAPTGIGVLFGKPEVLAAMPPWQGGGNMIADVTFEKTVYQAPPWRFEAGTGNIADAVGLGAALDYVSALGLENIGRYEHELLEYATRELGRVPGLHLIGTAPDKAGVLSFILDGVRTEDVGGALDQEGIAVRSGHHCAQPILRRFGVESTVRASLAPYNTCEDVDALVAALLRIQAGRPRA
jgi:SufS family cysteine desulfurase